MFNKTRKCHATSCSKTNNTTLNVYQSEENLQRQNLRTSCAYKQSRNSENIGGSRLVLNGRGLQPLMTYKCNYSVRKGEGTEALKWPTNTFLVKKKIDQRGWVAGLQCLKGGGLQPFVT